MSDTFKGFRNLRKFHAGGNDDYGAIQELQAGAQEARALAMDDMFGVQALDVFDVYKGVSGVLYHRNTGEIRRLVFTSQPYRHPTRNYWCVDIEGCPYVSLESIGIITSEEIDPEQEIAVVRADEVNIQRLAERLLTANQLSFERLRVLYPTLLG